MVQILSTPAAGLREFRLLPRYTPVGGGMRDVRLETRLCRDPDGGYLPLETPIVSAAMQSVTGRDMAIAMARLGGIGVLPVSQPIEAQCDAVRAVKRFKAGFQTDIVTLAPDQSLAEVSALMRETGFSTFPVTDTGVFHGRLLGVLTDKDFDPRSDGECSVADRMKRDVQTGVDLDDLEQANRLMIDYGRGFLPIVSSEGTLLSVVFKRDRDKHLEHPGESVDAEKRLRVAAAVSTHPEDRERVIALAECDVDLLVIDASDGHTEFQRQMIGWIKERTGLPVIGGNVVTAEGFDFLAESGADAVKVGMGIGSGCTTQEVKATGRGQATALYEVACARARRFEAHGDYVPVLGDGGMRGPADMVVALALGADALMLGNLLARFTESPGRLIRSPEGETVKEYWMEGTLRARNHRRYTQLEGTFFEEGVAGTVPHEGSAYDGLPTFASMLRSALSTAGCRTIRELHRSAVLEPQSEAALRTADIHGLLSVADSGAEFEGVSRNRAPVGLHPCRAA